MNDLNQQQADYFDGMADFYSDFAFDNAMNPDKFEANLAESRKYRRIADRFRGLPS